MISKSGGARMMEVAFSLMQMAKTAAKIALLDEKKIPYISFLTDPTTGGVTASKCNARRHQYCRAQKCLIAFAGPRVVKEPLEEPH